MKRILFALLLACAPQWAQEKPPEHLLIMLKYTNPAALSNLIRPYNVNFSFNEEMKVMTLSGPADAVDAVAAMIKQLDVPPKDIELTIYYMIGSEGENALGSAPPKELEPVVTQLRNAFTFKNYRLLDVLVIRTRTGQQASSAANLGTVTLANGNNHIINANFVLRSATIAPDGSTVRLDGMRNELRWPVTDQYTSTLSLNTDVDIREGQKVVVGRLGISHDQALFLVLTAKVVN
ncbi:MAG TPA: secretin N-terminal domain-containing protein [Bryobacteraceae bacterium]|nr:secretin N-terminal domain-containing protein [Bryobacteraceae bacterium]